MYCTKCGKSNDDQVSYCPSCGERAHRPLPPPVTELPIPTSSLTKGGASNRYAGFWLRAFATLVDASICLIIAIPIALPLAFLLGTEDLGNQPNLQSLEVYVQILLFPIGTMVAWIYFTLAESSGRQATLGKKLFRLRVTNTSGNRIGFGRANVRFWSKLISYFSFFIGFIIAGFTKRKQALHDLIAGTVVILDKEQNKASAAPLTASKKDSYDLRDDLKASQGLGHALFSFQGRLGRGGYWAWVIFFAIVQTAVAYWTAAFIAPEHPELIDSAVRAGSLLATLVLLWPGLAVSVKRWHDANKSGWWVLINLVPIIGWVASFVHNGFVAGTPGKNRFDNSGVPQ
jgi:uncharacterized RDD family membrane protein YckC